MLIDIISAIVLLFGFAYGFYRGFIHSIISLFAIVAGIAVAMKTSFIISVFLQNTFDLSSNALPIVSFILVFLSIVLILKLIAYILKKILQALSLNFLNRMAGGVFWILITIILLSILFWFADQNEMIPRSARKSSMAYRYCMPLAPIMLDFFGQVIPFFRDLFENFDTLFKETRPIEV